MIVGQGMHRYEVVEGWGLNLPDGLDYGDAPWVAVDAQDRVHVLTRAHRGVFVHTSEGELIGTWGEDLFVRAHGIRILPNDVVWCTDDGAPSVYEMDTSGQHVRTIGAKGAGGAAPEQMLRRPTQLAVSPDGSLYVSDGYGGNAVIHRFSPKGAYLGAWGEPGSGPGQFHLPHSLWVHTDGRVFVADRENDRIQIFDAQGRFLDLWPGIARPSDVWIDANNVVYTTELRSVAGEQTHGRTMTMTSPSRVTVRDLDGRPISTWGSDDIFLPDGFISAHSICVDSTGAIYVGQNTYRHLQDRYTPSHPKVRKFVPV